MNLCIIGSIGIYTNFSCKLLKDSESCILSESLESGLPFEW